MTTPTPPSLAQSFPFDVVVVTFPDEGAAEVAQQGPLSDLQSMYPDTLLLATCDPMGARCGSGGGTLAALEHVERRLRESQRSAQPSSSTILILHAGGDSSRCFTQMALGKAWTSLPLIQHRQQEAHDNDDNDVSMTTSKIIMSNPIHLGMEAIAKIFSKSHQLPAGSVVIAASDALLSVPQLDDSTLRFDIDHDNDGATLRRPDVVGVAFPAAWETAKNHGVYILQPLSPQDQLQQTPPTSPCSLASNSPNYDVHNTSGKGQALVVPIAKVLQKPSLATLQQEPYFHLSCGDMDYNNDDENGDDDGSPFSFTSHQRGLAWIDTGIIAFMPPAAQALRSLAQDLLRTCTLTGMKDVFDQGVNAGDPDLTYQDVTIKVDLYTHFLQALTIADCSNEQARLDAYVQAHGGNIKDGMTATLARGIFQTLAPFQFQALAIAQGRFLHLGTTRELHDFYTYGCRRRPRKRGLRQSSPSARRQDVENAIIPDAAAFVVDPLKPPTALASPTRYELYTQNCTYFGQELGLTRRMDVYARLPYNNTTCSIGTDCVLLGCLLVGASSPSFVGNGAVLEFCWWEQAVKDESTNSACLQIGANCLISGIRNLHPGENTESLRIPNNMCVQMMPLLSTDDNSMHHGKNCQHHDSEQAPKRYVYMTLGIDDPIKNHVTTTTIYGIPLEYFLEWADLSPDEIWDASLSESSRTLWNAQLHPVVSANATISIETSVNEELISYPSLFEWLNHLPSGEDLLTNKEPPALTNPTAKKSLLSWKRQSRISLAQVRDQSDAACEFRYRRNLLCQVIPVRQAQHCQEIQNLLFDRRHDECDWRPLLAATGCYGGANGKGSDSPEHHPDAQRPEVGQALACLDDVIQNAFIERELYDICGRACMVASALLADLAVTAAQKQDDSADDSEFQAKLTSCTTSIYVKCSQWLPSIESSLSTSTDRQASYSQIVKLRSQSLTSICMESSLGVSQILGEYSRVMESLARIMTSSYISGFLRDPTRASRKASGTTKRQSPIRDDWVIATAPARIDLSGGWSDTPPVFYEFGGKVTGVAVTVDGKKSLSCRCRLLALPEHEPTSVIVIRSELRDSTTCKLVSSVNVELSTLDDLGDARDPQASGALVKCALICLGLISVDDLMNCNKKHRRTLQLQVNRFCQSPDGTNARMEIVVTSLLPQGSGMGTSSILGGCVLAAVGRCVGIEFSNMMHPVDMVSKSITNGDLKEPTQDLMTAVLELEQILSTGGGYQDQVNGLIGGFKIVTTEPCRLPIQLNIQPIQINPAFESEFNQSLLLAFAGKTRLAKNILQNVLQRWARRTPEIVEAVHALVSGAQSAKEALEKGDLAAVGRCLSTYYEQKKIMAGEESGVEPSLVRDLLSILQSQHAVCGASLCGAGGGGFLAMVVAPGVDPSRVKSLVDEALASPRSSPDDNVSDDANAFSWHDCRICHEGLTTNVLVSSKDSSITAFDETWHSVEES